MANIYDTANQLEREIRELEQFQDLSGSFAELKKTKKLIVYLRNFKLFNKNYKKRCHKAKI